MHYKVCKMMEPDFKGISASKTADMYDYTLGMDI